MLFDTLLSVLAPHPCMVCGRDGSLLCDYCSSDALLPVPSRCYRCKRLTVDFATCLRCRRSTSLKHVFVRTDYEKTAKELVYALKFKRARASATVISRAMLEALPYLAPATIIVPVPTATSRVRQRGYDQAVLLSQSLARRHNLPYFRALFRITQSRQVGAARKLRLEQLRRAFYVPRVDTVQAKHILLVDDVITTGATLEAAARVMKQAGAKSVSAIVFASKQ